MGSRKHLIYLEVTLGKFSQRLKLAPPLFAGVLAIVLSSNANAAFSKVVFPTSDGLKLNARIYEPTSGGKLSPAILLVEGSGKSHFEEELESSPFFQLAKGLSDHGFFVMSYSKRGSASNSKNGTWAKSTFLIDNEDAQSAFDFLKSYKTVDAKKLFLFGQSIGCLHSTLLAQRNTISGLILFAGGYQNFLKILEEQNLEILALTGKTPAEAKKEIEPMMRALYDVRNGGFKCANHKTLCTTEDGVNIVDGTQEKYLEELLKIEPLDELAKVKSKTLILQGTSDFIIDPSEYQRAKARLENNKNFSFNLIEKVDHLMSDQADKKTSLHAMRSVPETWVTLYSGDIGNTFILNGSSTGSTRFATLSKYPRS